MTDVAELTARLSLALRDTGVPATPERAARLAAAMALDPPAGGSQLYWQARVTLVSDVSQLEAFGRVFAKVFSGLVDPAEWRGQEPPAPSRRATETSPPSTTPN